MIFDITYWEMFLLLVGCHFLADYPLQGEFLAKGKNHNDPIEGIPFYHPLVAHASIHGLFVGIITGSWSLGILETFWHTYIDWLKCDKLISYHVDQAAHIILKAVYVLILML